MHGVHATQIKCLIYLLIIQPLQVHKLIRIGEEVAAGVHEAPGCSILDVLRCQQRHVRSRDVADEAGSERLLTLEQR